jgi:hypothetical protein
MPGPKKRLSAQDALTALVDLYEHYGFGADTQYSTEMAQTVLVRAVQDGLVRVPKRRQPSMEPAAIRKRKQRYKEGAFRKENVAFLLRALMGERDT